MDESEKQFIVNLIAKLEEKTAHLKAFLYGTEKGPGTAQTDLLSGGGPTTDPTRPG